MPPSRRKLALCRASHAMVDVIKERDAASKEKDGLKCYAGRKMMRVRDGDPLYDFV